MKDPFGTVLKINLTIILVIIMILPLWYANVSFYLMNLVFYHYICFKTVKYNYAYFTEQLSILESILLTNSIYLLKKTIIYFYYLAFYISDC